MVTDTPLLQKEHIDVKKWVLDPMELWAKNDYMSPLYIYYVDREKG